MSSFLLGSRYPYRGFNLCFSGSSDQFPGGRASWQLALRRDLLRSSLDGKWHSRGKGVNEPKDCGRTISSPLNTLIYFLFLFSFSVWIRDSPDINIVGCQQSSRNFSKFPFIDCKCTYLRTGWWGFDIVVLSSRYVASSCHQVYQPGRPP